MYMLHDTQHITLQYHLALSMHTAIWPLTVDIALSLEKISDSPFLPDGINGCLKALYLAYCLARKSIPLEFIITLKSQKQHQQLGCIYM